MKIDIFIGKHAETWLLNRNIILSDIWHFKVCQKSSIKMFYRSQNYA